MKRFFQPLQKEGSFKKMAVVPPLPAAAAVPEGEAGEGIEGIIPSEDVNIEREADVAPAATAAVVPAPAEEEASAEVSAEAEAEADPTKFLSWNANSFLLRVKNNREELLQLIRSFDPDVIALQEVRLPAAGHNKEPKNRCKIKDDTNAARDDRAVIMQALSKEPLSNFQAWWSLADSKYSGTALLIKSCFKPLSVRYTISANSAPGLHEPDGRMILAEFNGVRLLNTYVPNNGWKDEALGFQRRRKWDKKIHEFVTEPSTKPLIWCGDLNVSHKDVDVTHPEYFQNAKQNGYTPPNREDVGQPGFTNAEKQRFTKFLTDGKLIDSYRWLHKEQEPDNGFSWSGNPVGKYRGKRMRIDYFLISQQLLGRLRHSNILGSGVELQGFCGSDHCPITLELSQSQGSKDTSEDRVLP